MYIIIPKTEKALARGFQRCSRQKSFVEIEKESYRDYQAEALADLDSAVKELKEGDVKWAIVKAYQALFSQCTALLVKNLGLYSKDHSCLILALLKHGLVREETLKKISELFKDRESLFEEINKLRLFRNKAMYFPKTQSKLALQEASNAIEETRKLIAILSEEL